MNQFTEQHNISIHRIKNEVIMLYCYCIILFIMLFKCLLMVHINSVQLPQEEVKYLGLHLDRDLPGTNTFPQNGNNYE
jgi:hypothetical protein